MVSPAERRTCVLFRVASVLAPFADEITGYQEGGPYDEEGQCEDDRQRRFNECRPRGCRRK